MKKKDELVVVGASLAGVRSAEAARRRGFAGTLTLVGAETHFPPYDRPPLSKQLLAGEWQEQRARLRVAEGLQADLHLGVRAQSLDLEDHRVTLEDGTTLNFDGLVVATGASARRLPIEGPAEGVFVLRTFDDCLALREALRPGARVVIIGAGFIGCEVAASCRKMNLDVTVVESLRWPMDRVFGEVLGSWAAGLHRSHGVDLRLGASVVGIEGEGHVEKVCLADGSEIAADVVVVAIGVTPETAWLTGSGLTLRDGLVLDASCRAPGSPEVVGAGDVARWHNPLFDREMRVEHWTNAVEQAEAAVRTLLDDSDEPEPFSTVPYVWSDQYDRKLQFVGIGGAFHSVTEGAMDDNSFVATFVSEGRLVGALCVNRPGRLIRYKRFIAARAEIGELAGLVES